MIFGNYNYGEKSWGKEKMNWRDINHFQNVGLPLSKEEKRCPLYDRIEESLIGICGLDKEEVDERGGCHNPESCLKLKNFGIKIRKV